MADLNDQTRLVFFDGTCRLCHAGVRFLLRHDRAQRLQFSSLESETAQRVLGPFGIDAAHINSIVLYDRGVIYERSTAAVKIAENLDWPWSCLRIIGCIPRKIRDRIYDSIARNRYRWFGRNEYCEIIKPENEKRFL